MRNSEIIIKNSPYKPILKTVIDYVRESEDSFTIRLDWELSHKPGQFVFCSLPGIGEAPISICSYSDKYLELNIHQVGNLTNALARIKVGDRLLVRGPYGKPYPMEHFVGNNVVIIGGGCGVAPLKSVIEYIEKHRADFREVYLFFGFRNPENILFRNRIESWRKNYQIQISFDKVETKTCFGGKQGFVTQLVNEMIGDNFNKVVFICGPPVMIEASCQVLLKKGFNEDQIFLSAERFMYCGMGKCGRCMIHGKYTCLDGAVFRYDDLIKDFKEE